ncbi:MAG: pilus assembly protein PilO, partial [Proteobacteria bacterium]
MKLEDLRSLDPRDPGRWPLAVRAGAIALWFIVLSLLLLYFLVWNTQQPELERVEADETRLRTEFKDKHSKA